MKPFSAPGRVAIGLTGPIASGKSFALECFVKAGAFGVSMDAVSASLLTEPAVCNKILRKFGPEKILTNGLLDKKKLAAEVFGSPAGRKWLEGLLHPKILRRTHSLIKRSDKKIAVVETPLLFEAGLAEGFTFTVCLAAPEEELKARALKRGWTPAQYRARTRAQFPARRKYAMADLVLDNSGTKAALAGQIRSICRTLGAALKKRKKH